MIEFIPIVEPVIVSSDSLYMAIGKADIVHFVMSRNGITFIGIGQLTCMTVHIPGIQKSVTGTGTGNIGNTAVDHDDPGRVFHPYSFIQFIGNSRSVYIADQFFAVLKSAGIAVKFRVIPVTVCRNIIFSRSGIHGVGTAVETSGRKEFAFNHSDDPKTSVIQRRHIVTVITVGVVQRSKGDLLQVVGTVGKIPALTGFLQCGEQNGCQNSDNGDDNEQFNKGKACTLYPP